MDSTSNTTKTTSDTKYLIIFCLGQPGSGKNTQCNLVKTKYNIVHFGTGDLLRAEAKNPDSKVGQEINQMIKDGVIVPSVITCKLAKNHMEKFGKNKVFLIDGFPRNKENLEGMEKVFGSEFSILAVLYLHCSEEICSFRIKKRALDSGRVDDNEDSLRKRFKVFENETLPNINELSLITKVMKIDSSGDDRMVVHKNICEGFDEMKVEKI